VPPIFLQQAAHLTEGIYWRWNGRGGLLQYLHVSWVRAPSEATRHWVQSLNLRSLLFGDRNRLRSDLCVSSS
jgi:hypothetical protein